jgi:hypothetical protein
VKPPTLIRLALAGTRTDVLRVVLTALTAALAAVVVLCAITVLLIRDRLPVVIGSDSVDRPLNDQYTNALLRESGLRPGVALALGLLAIPVLALAGQCARLGAPARDRRLAAVRMAGATPGQAIRIAMAETAMAALLGAGAGLGAYLVGRQVLHRPNAQGRLPLPTDVLPATWLLAAVTLGLPALAGLTVLLTMRKVAVGPFGVVRRVRRTQGPRPWPGLVIVLGISTIAAVQPLELWYDQRGAVMPSWVLPVALLGGGLLATLGVVLGTGWISYTAGRMLGRFAQHPAALIAARRLTADPWTGSRTFAALLACVLFGAGALGVKAWFRAEFAVQREADRASAAAHGDVFVSDAQQSDFFLRTMDLVDLAVIVALLIATGGLLVALAEGVVSRRRTNAALVATGVPRAVLGRALVWQSLAPAVPAIMLAATVGAVLPRGIVSEVRAGGGSWEVCEADKVICDNPATAAAYLRLHEEPLIVRAIGVPFGELAQHTGVALGAVLLTVGIGLLLLRGSASVEELRVG